MSDYDDYIEVMWSEYEERYWTELSEIERALEKRRSYVFSMDELIVLAEESENGS